MGLAQSPRISTNGLVFAFDKDNFKSYKGPAIQNLATAIVAATQSGTGYSFTAGSESVNIPGVGATTAQTITGYNNYSAVSAVCCPNLFYFVPSNGTVHVLPSTTYTYGLVYKTQSGYTHPNFMYRYEYSATDVYNGEQGVHSTTNRIHLGDGWYWAWATFTTNPTTTKLYLRYFYYNYSTNNDKMSVAKVLVTPGTYTGLHPKYWPDVAATKASSNTLYDLTGTNTITANSLTYAANGSYSFNGTSNFIDSGPVSGTGTSTQSLTWACWVQPTAASGDIINMVYPAGGWNMCPIYASGQTFYAKVWSNTSLADVTTFTLNQYYYLALVRDNTAGTNSFYVNGILVASQVGSYSSSGVSNNHFFGKAGAQATNTYFSGNIPVAQIYNRALSAAEVKQNFNALRGRFGI